MSDTRGHWHVQSICCGFDPANENTCNCVISIDPWARYYILIKAYKLLSPINKTLCWLHTLIALTMSIRSTLYIIGRSVIALLEYLIQLLLNSAKPGVSINWSGLDITVPALWYSVWCGTINEPLEARPHDSWMTKQGHPIQPPAHMHVYTYTNWNRIGHHNVHIYLEFAFAIGSPNETSACWRRALG